ncbi:Flp family type IVb pilin [Sulfuriflexus sp.]|uniref:Flp family type IVb pilin n=1 Tax=Sulfuriflexus sp. TaxID=2015443 RepID=UPI0028CDF882|nr:Flp family type IVb pilin [Sulfuriflexus sp.]MDT8403043.1 Flp family type IVb pilin [Sulfuriflexus sp.]
MKKHFNRFMKEESGASMVEYAILVALISVVAIVIIGVLGQQINAAFTAVSNQLAAAGVVAP